MKKILIISSFPAPYRVAVFQGLAQHYDVDVFFEFVKDQSRSAEWFVRDKRFHILTDPGEMNCFRGCVRKLKEYDLVLAYDYNNKNARNLMLHCILRKVPYCINCDGAFINRHWLKDAVKRLFISNAKACFASGVHAKEYFLNYGAKEENIHYHRFTSLVKGDILKEPLTASAKEAIRKELALPERMKIVLSIGQFIPRKGYDILLQAWKGIEDAALVLIGGGDLEKEYEELQTQLGLKNVIVRGFMPKKMVWSYYQASDVFVLPTREDIWGLVINEAMANGLPVISSDRCIAAMELIENGVNGYVEPVEDVERLHLRLTELIQSDTLCKKMGWNNVEKMQQCTIENIVQSHIEVIDQL